MYSPDKAIAVLRIVVGVWFLKAVWTKLTLGFFAAAVPYPAVAPRFIAFQPRRVAEFAAGNPVGWYKDFLESMVLPHAASFAILQTYGEVVVGLGLVLGLLTPLSAVIGLFLAVNYGLATQWMSFGQQGFHVMLITAMIIFLVTRAGRVWGVDRLLVGVSGTRRWLRILIALVMMLVTNGAAHAELRIFVTNEKSNDVTVIQAASGDVLKTIPVGQRPRGVTVSADGRQVVVANSNSDEIAVIDAASLAVVKTARAGRDPEGVTFNRDSTKLYAVNENEQAVTVLDAKTWAVLKTIPVGTEPETAVLSPDGKWIAVSNETSNDIHLIDTSTDSVVAKVGVPKNPRGMRFSPDSMLLYVASEQAHVVSIIDVARRTVVKSAPTGGSRPVDIALSSDGQRAWVSHGNSGDVRLLDARTLEVKATIPVGPRAWWTAMTPDGSRLYVTVGRANEIAIIDTRTNSVSGRIKTGTLPWGIAIADVP